MYVYPNTGGILFQALAVTCPCCLLLIVVGGVVGAVIYFVRKGKKNQQSDFTKDSTS